MKKIYSLLLLLLPVLAKAQYTINITASADTICMGVPVSFNAAVTGTLPHYKWEVNGVHQGTDTPAYTSSSLSNGDTVVCEVTDAGGSTVFATSNKIGMVVHPLPFAGVINGRDSVCIGTTITLTGTVPGGTWGASNGYATIAGGVVTGVYAVEEGPPPNDTIFYAVSNPWCTDTAKKIIVVNPQPDASFYIGPPLNQQLCVGGTYLINGGDGVNGALHAVNGSVLYGLYIPEALSIDVVHPGNDVLISTYTNSCGSDTFKLNITIGPPPLGTITASSTNICVGDTIILADTSMAGEPAWHASNAYALTGYNTAVNVYQQLIIGIAPGLDTITLNVSNVCGSTNDSIPISVNPPPPPPTGADTVCKGNTALWGDAVTGGTWASSTPGIAVMGTATGIVSGIADGVAAITYTLPSGCYAASSVVVNTCENDGVIYPGLHGNEIVVYDYSNLYQYYTIFNSIGQIVMHQSLTLPVTNINIAALAPGLYIIKLNGANKDTVTKFVKR